MCEVELERVQKVAGGCKIGPANNYSSASIDNGEEFEQMFPFSGA